MTAYNIKQGARGGGEPPGACDAPPINRIEGAWDAPPINRIAVTIKVLLLYIFAMLLLAVKYMAYKLLTDAASRRPLNRLAITIAESQNKHLCNSIA